MTCQENTQKTIVDDPLIKLGRQGYPNVAIDSPRDFAIAVIGMGIQRVAHMTLEAILVLQRCRQGFVAGLDQKSVEEFRRALVSHLGSDELLPPLVSLSPAYRPDRKRRENYVEAADAVLDGAATQAPVAYLTPGNPIVYDRVAKEILDGARARGLSVAVVPGISSIDTVLVDLRQEPGPGLQIYEASCFVGSGVKPDTRYGCLLMQVGVFGTNYAVLGREPHVQALAPLKKYLLQFYPAAHLTVLVRSAAREDRGASIHHVSVESLDHVPANLQQGASLFIPALSAPQLDKAFHARMECLDQLNAHYPKS